MGRRFRRGHYFRSGLLSDHRTMVMVDNVEITVKAGTGSSTAFITRSTCEPTAMEMVDYGAHMGRGLGI